MSGYETAGQRAAARRHVSATKVGMVFRKTIGQYWVDVDGQTVLCTISSRLHKVLVYPMADASSRHPRVQEVKGIQVVDPIAVGDIVSFVSSGDDTGMINEVVERRSALVRRAAGRKLQEQVIVANVDQLVCVVAAAHPQPSWELVDRYLVAAEASEVPAIICVPKADLADRTRLKRESEEFRRIGYTVIITSAPTGEGIADLKEVLSNRVSVFASKSGVGKTTLLNSLEPGLGLRVNAVSDKVGKGKHTTTHLEMFALPGGGSVVDTPGMREFGLWNIRDQEMQSLFRELRAYIGRCRFGSTCSHDYEPGCAVRAAVADGLTVPVDSAAILSCARNKGRPTVA